MTPQQHHQAITINTIRGGRFCATLSHQVARQLSDAVASMNPEKAPPKGEVDSLQMRLRGGHVMSQGDLLLLSRLRPEFPNLGSDAVSALDQVGAFIRQRTEALGKRPGVQRSPWGPKLVLPPRSVDATQAERGE